MKVLLACGGTGGHIFPGVALAECFKKKVSGCEIVFAGTPRGLEKEIFGKTAWRLEMIETPSVADKKGLEKLKAVFALWNAFVSARRLIAKENPDLVLGVGGYVSAPILLASCWKKIPTAALEINAIPGLANRLLKYFVGRIFVAAPEVARFFRKKKTCVTGVPVREDLFRVRQKNPDRFVVLVFGGSLGAKKLNELMLATLPHIREEKNRFYFIHQVGRQAKTADVEKAYHDSGFSCEVHPFIDAMGEAYARADFVIARAGANTVAELAALRKPSLLIPYPHSAGGHQVANAQMLETLGGSTMMLENCAFGESVARLLKKLLSSPQLLETMADHLSQVGSSKAAEKIVKVCLEEMHV